MVGRSAPEAHFRRDNLVGAVIIALAAHVDRDRPDRVAADPEQWRRIAELERALGRKTYELEIAGKLLRRRSARRALRLPS